jgi:Mg-chelatase subunit ChlD
MNQLPLDTVGDESVEARIVAWVLGETSAFEAAELERLCEERPELLIFRRRMLALHGLLGETETAETDHSWKLPPEKRKALDEILGEGKVTCLEPKPELRIHRSGWRALFAIAACLVLTIVVARLIGPIGRIGPIKSAIATDTATPPQATSEVALHELNKAVRDQEDKVEERRKVLATKKDTGTLQRARQDVLAKQSADRQRNEKPADFPQSAALTEPSDNSAMEAMPPIAATGMAGGLGDGFIGNVIAADSVVPQVSTQPEGRLMSSAPTLSRLNSADKELKRQSAPKPRTVAKNAQLRVDNLGQELSLPAERKLALADASSLDPLPKDEGDVTNAATSELAPSQTDSGDLADGKDSRFSTEPAPAPADLIEEIPAVENPYSTFSLNISDASFQLAKAALGNGERPDPASIKTEQFYNAVDYGDPAPAPSEPVAATIEQSVHPVIPGRNLVRVALRTGSVGRSAVQPLRLTLLVDQSGSMVREDRRAGMEYALAQLGVLLTQADLVTVIGFSRSPHLLADGMTGDQATKLAELVNQTASEGGTNLEEALKLGGQLAERHQLAGAQNRIVLFTDGAANLGDANPDRLAEQVKSFRQKGLAFDIAGIGADGLNDRLLSELARNGNGRYYIVGSDKSDSFARQLAGAFRPAAENVKVQVSFNPQRVGKYKLIGFEKDRLKTEDFRNDAVDAAELAAEEAGVALYQVELLADGTGEIGEVGVRFRDAASQEMVERNWTIPHESQATAFDRATPSMQLAGLSLLAAEKLQGGPLADAIDFKQLTGPTSQVRQFYGSSPRVADMLQVIEKLK